MKGPALISRQTNPVLVNLRGVYVIQCIPNGRFYIGSSVCIETRWREHITAMLKPLSQEAQALSNPRLCQDAKEFGLDKFQFRILKLYPYVSVEELREKEELFIKQSNPYYNIIK